ncbi:MAG: WD40 repeat domain-containing protein, partial [Candidatus Helarchaeota archaeon]
VSGSRDSKIRIWELESAKLIRTLEGHVGQINSIVISRDGKYIISGSSGETILGRSNTVNLWELNSGNLIKILIGHKKGVFSVAISPNGNYIVSGSEDGSIKIWDVRSGNLLHTIRAHTIAVYSVAISPNNKYFISGSLDKTIKIWDLKSGSLIHTIQAHKNAVSSVKFASNGKFILSGSWDNLIKIWSFKEKKEEIVEKRKKIIKSLEDSIKDLELTSKKLKKEEHLIVPHKIFFDSYFEIPNETLFQMFLDLSEVIPGVIEKQELDEKSIEIIRGSEKWLFELVDLEMPNYISYKYKNSNWGIGRVEFEFIKEDPGCKLQIFDTIEKFGIKKQHFFSSEVYGSLIKKFFSPLIVEKKFQTRKFDKRKVLYGMILTRHEIDLNRATKILKGVKKEELEGLIYELAGTGRIQGKFEGEIFKIHSNIEHFVKQIKNEFDEESENE